MGQTDMPGHDLLVRLLEVLTSLRERARLFVDVLANERQAVKTLAMDQLTAVNESKLRLLEELSMYEDVRVDLVRQLEAIWKVPSDTLTIGHIVGRVGGSVAEQLKYQQTQLNQSILAARHSNQITGALLHKSLAFLHEAVSIVRAPFHVQLSLYSESGSMHAPTIEGGLLERRG